MRRPQRWILVLSLGVLCALLARIQTADGRLQAPINSHNGRQTRVVSRRDHSRQKPSGVDQQESFAVDATGFSSPSLNCPVSCSDPPVIGVLSQPLRLVDSRSNGTKPFFYIAASYVKWLEAGGARTVAVPYDADGELLDNVLDQIHMLFLPGGEADLSPAVSHLLGKIHEANSNRPVVDGNNTNSSSSTSFPVWGTCLGMEFLLSYFGQNGSPLEEAFDAENMSLPLQNVIRRPHPATRDEDDCGGEATRSLYSDPSVYDIVTKQPVTLNNHKKGMSPETFRSNAKLANLWRVTSTNVDRRGKPFVSTLEPTSLQFPYYGVQYHPEKNPFEYGFQVGTTIPYEVINHSPDAVRFSLYVAQFVVDLARRSRRARSYSCCPLSCSQSLRRHRDCRADDNGAHSETREATRGPCSASSYRHEYTDPGRFPPIYSYPIQSGIVPGFEQVFLIPPASAWSPSLTSSSTSSVS